MKKYQSSLEKYGLFSEKLNNELIGFVLNVIVDKDGNIASQTQFSKDIYLLRDNILYRLSAIARHIHNICQQHVYFEQSFKTNLDNYDLIQSHDIQSFSFDDFIFNLLSLYDYFANLLAFKFISIHKKKMGWNSFSKASMDKNNKLSELGFSKSVAEHENKWVKRLQDFRAEIIHYNLNQGKARQEINCQKGEETKFEVQFSIPNKLAKKLKLESPSYNEVGIDLQFGVIEIAQKSITWLAELTELLTIDYTNNTIKKA